VKCILVVDDNAVMRHTWRTEFEDIAGWAVCGEAENGRDAIDEARVVRPDLIVLDLSMPIMNGLEAAPVLRCMLPIQSAPSLGDVEIASATELIPSAKPESQAQPTCVISGGTEHAVNVNTQDAAAECVAYPSGICWTGNSEPSSPYPAHLHC
jgi:CheY-like chemotaxis protein